MKQLKTSFILLFFLTILIGIIYPCFMWGIGELFFHQKTNGTLIHSQDGKVIGSEWIAQNFTSAKYFHPRPSNAGDKGYDASNSSGSNLGPTSQKLMDTLKQRADTYRTENNLTGDVPADAVTASGSGLDPHISVANAQIQAARIAAARTISKETVDRLIRDFTEERTLSLFGEKRINVLRINLELDQLVLKN